MKKSTLINNCMVGGAIGDALGLPYEGLSGNRINKLFKNRLHFNLIPVLQCGMVSDDTEHAVMTVQAWINSRHPDKDRALYLFEKRLKHHLRLWFLCLPAGIGAATAKSLFKMWLFLPNTGVFSAGNGPAMRAAVLGGLINDIEELKRYIHISTNITHTDPKAEQGALVIALCSYYFAKNEQVVRDDLLSFIVSHTEDGELQDYLCSITQAVDDGVTLSDWVSRVFNKHQITGYMYHTVPAVFYVIVKFPDLPMKGFDELINAGGDVDTTCAIAGGIWGTKHADQMVSSTKGCLIEPKITFKFIEKLSNQVDCDNKGQKAVSFGGLITLVRNLFFLFVVLLHGFRRLLPPY